MNTIPQPDWHPIAASTDLVFRHVFHGKLAGQELAVWRADDGNVNIWENRCLHRGVRLSIGMNDGAELKCQYHGWRYANRSASCTYIPAHPANSPARQVTNRTFPVAERYGLVWSALEAGATFPELPEGDWFALRAVTVDAPAQTVLEGLAEAATQLVPLSPLAFGLVLRAAPEERLIVFAQPLDAGTVVLRALRDGTPDDAEPTLRRFNRILTGLRDRIEAAIVIRPDTVEPDFAPVSADLAALPAPRSGALTVVVARKWWAAEDVVGLELKPLSGTLPAFQPGAHIDVTLPDGTLRQYSLTNGPGEWESWVIGVRRQRDSRGGSRMIAEQLREGDLLAVSEPRHKFPLRRDATRTVLIAGGIGITPLLAMAKALQHGGHPFELHAFARSAGHLPFADRLQAFGDHLHRHLGQDPDQTAAAVRSLLGPHGFAQHVYVCGSARMIDTVTRAAADLGWPEEAVHYEHFSNDRAIDASSAFTVELARSALTVSVPPGVTLLAAIRDAGVTVPSSCEKGACGTCVVPVLDGVPDHQDVYLNATEKRACRAIVTCVSRAQTARLVLDL
jgi:ferredoxin-NADP reductase/nitrite reductase/ring-hydroxylating ferredoxin subunit